MFRFLARSLSFWLFAAALVAFVHDGANSIAASELKIASIGEVWFGLSPPSINLTQAVIERYTLPFLWDPVLVSFLSLPAGIALMLISFLFAFLGRRRRSVAIGLDMR